MWGLSASRAIRGARLRVGERARTRRSRPGSRRRSRTLPRLQVADVPTSVLNVAGLAFEPSFICLVHVAHQKSAAGNAVPRIDRGERGYASARARSGVL